MSKEDVYSVVFRESGKEHMSGCTDKELEQIRKAIIFIKEADAQRPDRATQKQLWKIRQLEKELGWDKNPKRLQSFIQKYYHADQLEWLKFQEASSLIDSLKNVLAKEAEKREEDGR